MKKILEIWARKTSSGMCEVLHSKGGWWRTPSPGKSVLPGGWNAQVVTEKYVESIEAYWRLWNVFYDKKSCGSQGFQGPLYLVSMRLTSGGVSFHRDQKCNTQPFYQSGLWQVKQNTNVAHIHQQHPVWLVFKGLLAWTYGRRKILGRLVGEFRTHSP